MTKQMIERITTVEQPSLTTTEAPPLATDQSADLLDRQEAALDRLSSIVGDAKLVALSDLARAYGCSTANLRERIERGTLVAEKVGKQWIVYRAQANVLMLELVQR